MAAPTVSFPIRLPLSREKPLQFALAVGIAAMVLYLPSIGHGFVWDDRAAILGNGDVTGANPWSDMWFHDFWGADINLASSHKSFRPLTTVTFRLNHMISGRGAWSYHAFNVLFHGIATALFGLIVSDITRSLWRAWIASLIFAVHPVHVEAVSSLVGRAETLSAVFGMLAVLCYIRCADEQRGPLQSAAYLAVSIASVLLATLCKEVGITVFGILVCYDMAFSLVPKWQLPGPPMAIRWAAMTGATFVFMMYRLSLHGTAPLYAWTILENQFYAMKPGFARFLSVLFTHVLYGKLLVWPTGLAFDHGFANNVPILSVLDARVLAIVAMYGFVAAVVWYCVKKQYSVELFGLGWLAASFLPASNLIVFVGTEVAERLLYLPSAGFCLAVCTWWPRRTTVVLPNLPVAAAWLKQWAVAAPTSASSQSDDEDDSDSDGSDGAAPDAGKMVIPWSMFRMTLIATALCIFCVQAVSRSAAWRSELDLFKADLITSPLSLKELNNYGFMMLNGKPDELRLGVRYLQRAIALHPGFHNAHYNLALSYRALGHRDQYVASLRKAAAGSGAGIKVFAYLGQYHVEEWSSGRSHDHITGENHEVAAATYLNYAVAQGCRLAMLYAARGNMAFEQKKWHDAIREYTIAIEMAKDEIANGETLTVGVWQTYNQMAISYENIGLLEESVEHYRKAIANGAEPLSYSNAASILMKLGRAEEGIEMHRVAISQPGAGGDVFTNAGHAMETVGRLAEAVQLYTRAFELSPDITQVAHNYRVAMTELVPKMKAAGLAV